jgi:hypothetical protein
MPANTITEAKSSPRSQRVDVELVDDHVGHGLLGDQTVGRMCVAVDVVDDQGAADPINGVLLFELHVSGVEAAHEAHLDDSTPQRHFGVEHGLGFGLAGGERLPAQDRFTGFEPEHQLLGVHASGEAIITASTSSVSKTSGGAATLRAPSRQPVRRPRRHRSRTRRSLWHRRSPGPGWWRARSRYCRHRSHLLGRSYLSLKLAAPWSHAYSAAVQVVDHLHDHHGMVGARGHAVAEEAAQCPLQLGVLYAIGHKHGQIPASP